MEIKERIRAELSLPPFAAMISLQQATLSNAALHCYLPRNQERAAPLFVAGDPYHLHVPILAGGQQQRLPATLASRTSDGQGGWQLRFVFSDDVAQEITPLLMDFPRTKPEYDDERDPSV